MLVRKFLSEFDLIIMYSVMELQLNLKACRYLIPNINPIAQVG